MIELYLVEIVGIDGSHIGLERFMDMSDAMEFVDNYDGSSSYCNLYEARQIDY